MGVAQERPVMDRFLAWADKRHFVSVRALTLYVTLLMTWDAFRWAASYASQVIDKPQLATAAIIAAVTAPVSALQGFVFKWYMDSKKVAP